MTANPATARVVESNGHVRAPAGIRDLASFEQWMRSDEFASQGRGTHGSGRGARAGAILLVGRLLWVDLTRERTYSHNDVKEAVAAVLWPLARDWSRPLLRRWHA